MSRINRLDRLSLESFSSNICERGKEGYDASPRLDIHQLHSQILESLETNALAYFSAVSVTKEVSFGTFPSVLLQN